MRKAAMGWLVIMLVVLGLGSSGRAAPAPQTLYVGENEICDYDTIAEAITYANPGDTIRVQYDTYNEPPLVVNKALTIIGGYWKALYGDQACLTENGVGLVTVHPAAPVASPIFRVQGANVYVQWFIFENGASEGVAVDGGGTLELVDSIVQNNAGDGLSVSDATASLLEVEVLDNGLAGAAVDSGGTLELVDSIVQNNGDGGLTVSGATANLLRSEILGNNRDYGGGIYMDTSARVTASDSLIKGNQGWNQGAGVYLRGGSAFSAIEGTGIEKNVTMVGCYDGGGIAAIGPGTEVTIDASQVVSNTALTRGGGLYLAGGAQAWVQNWSWVQENRTFGPTAGGGGGIHLTGGSALHAQDSIFYLNSSDPNGGGVYADLGSTVQAANTLFWENLGGDSGGGIYNNGGNITCRSCYFLVNRVVDYHGGAIASIGPVASLDVDRSMFVQNTTDSGNGGAIFTDEPYTFVRRSYFTGNTAPGDGSALFLSGIGLPPLSIREAVIENNYVVDNPTPAVVPDGAESAPASIEGPEGPPANGSSLYAESLTVHLKHNTFAHETQLYHFGVLADAEATVHMTNNILTNFSVAFHRSTTGTGAAYASHTLFWHNLYDYGTGVLVSTNEVAGDPAFVGGTDYNLTAVSAAIDAGIDAGVLYDYFGGHRPWGSGFEIGAEEYPRQKHVFLPAVMK